MKKVPSIIDFADGSVVDRINFELAKLIENIKNPNTDEKVRTLEIKIKLTPKNGRKSIDAEYSVVGKPRPISPVNASMVVQQTEGSTAIFEADGIGEGQVDLFGEVHQVKYIELSNNSIKVKED